MVILNLEGRCDQESLASAISSVNWGDNYDQRVAFLLKGKPFVTPSFLASLVAWGIPFVEAGGEMSFVGDGGVLDYLSRMDVFNLLHFDYPELFNRQNEQGRFLPVFVVENEESVAFATESICELVLQRFDNAREFLPAMEWCVSEVIDNVRVHSGSDSAGAVCAQYYPSKHRLAIAVVDCGRGIKATLSERLELDSHGQAIERALERGMTRNPNIGQGNGLAGTRAIASLNSGKLEVRSGDGQYRLNSDGQEEIGSCTSMAGTGVYIRLDTQTPVDLAQTFIGDSGWNYITYVATRTEDSHGLKIRDECRHTLGRETARPLRRKIEALLPDLDGPLNLDFVGIRNASSSFLDELLGRLTESLGEEQFLQRIHIVGATTHLLRMSNVVINQRMTETPIKE